jgi:MOSC domain-containing protein YiiM
MTAIFVAVSGPVVVKLMGLAGDEQADLSVHAGLDKATPYPSSTIPTADARAAPVTLKLTTPLMFGPRET